MAQRPFFSLYRNQGRSPASPFSARRAGRRRSRHAGFGGVSDQGLRWGALRPGHASSSPLQRKLVARRPSATERCHARDAARRAHVGLHWWRRRGHGAPWVRPASPCIHHHLLHKSSAPRPAHSTRHVLPRRLAQIQRGVGRVPCSPARPAPSQAPVNGGGSRPGFSAGVRRLRQRVLPVTNTRTAPRPKQDPSGATRAWHPGSTARHGDVLPSNPARQPKFPP
jgi:hypothetical protein